MMSIDSTPPMFTDLWQTFLAFGRFEIFITPPLLVAVYWFGAVGIPLLTVLTVRRLSRRLALPEFTDLPYWQRNRLLIVVTGLLMFVFAELMWRMLIETVLAYFQMRDALINADSI